MRFTFIKWKIKYQGASCVEKTFKDMVAHVEACFLETTRWDIFKNLWIYPIIMTDEEYNELPEFNGW